MQNQQLLVDKLRAIEARAAYIESTAYVDPSHHRRANKLRTVRNLEMQAERIRKLLQRMGVNLDLAK